MNALVLACLWVLLAAAAAALPSRFHWRAAYVLIALGLPLLVHVVMQHGWVWGAVVLAGGASVLRWPLLYLVRWCGARMRVITGATRKD